MARAAGRSRRRARPPKTRTRLLVGNPRRRVERRALAREADRHARFELHAVGQRVGDRVLVSKLVPELAEQARQSVGAVPGDLLVPTAGLFGAVAEHVVLVAVLTERAERLAGLRHGRRSGLGRPGL